MVTSLRTSLSVLDSLRGRVGTGLDMRYDSGQVRNVYGGSYGFCRMLPKNLGESTVSKN